MKNQLVSQIICTCILAITATGLATASISDAQPPSLVDDTPSLEDINLGTSGTLGDEMNPADSKTSAPESSSAQQNSTIQPFVRRGLGCDLRLDDIHASRHVPGNMNVVFTVSCPLSLPELHIEAQLWEVRWWGWDRIGIRGTESRYNASYAQTNASDRCRNNRIRATANGYGIHFGMRYEGPEQRRYANNPCNL